jgi:putative ABC transport system permease protein
MRLATPSYFETLSVRIRRGRAFAAAEGSGAVALVNEALVALYFPDEEPIGKRVQTGPAEFAGSWATIVGVVDNAATHSVTEESPAASIYFPMGFVDSEVGISRHNVTYVVRASTPPLGLLPAVREALREFDPALALADAATMERVVADSGARISFALILLGIAAGTALLLGAIGIYGVISYTVTRRTGEIGVRLALGARPGDVVRMIVRQGANGVVAGLVLGLLAAVGFGRFMDAILVGVPSTDLVTYGAVAVVLGALGAAAMWIPARRAAAMDPVSALRAD